MCTSIPLFLVFSACVLFELRVRTEGVFFVHTNCVDCHYSLAGLPDRGICPECGAGYEPVRRLRYTEHVVRRRGTTVYWAVCVLLGLAIETSDVGRHLYAWGAILSYLEDGYRLDVAINAAFNRELRGGGAFRADVVTSFWVGCTPIIGLVTRGRARYAVLLTGTAAVLLAVTLAGL